MRSYIVLNGKESTLIEGLLIQSLPPISKPLMRTRVEEIDGRDGDIVTKLGYAAYDKTVTIGLYGQYDVDSVIAYFDSEGVVTFSNEIDKYYKYQIIEQIDFERLLRFKTATVTFHVQPFKYSNVEEAITVTSGKTLNVTNRGNTFARPQITINGSGNITLKLNGATIFRIALGTEGYITIDAEQMEASKDGILKNRLVTGDYDNFALRTGKNTITWTGTTTSVSISRYSRWI